MALLHVTYFSQALAGQSEFYLALPNDVPPFMAAENPRYQRDMKTLVLLHGYSGGAADWVTGSSVQNLALQYNMALIMPNGRNSFYLDREATGEQYATFVGEELPGYVRKTFGLSAKREDTFIGGYSMGGFGALHTGLAYSHNYSKIAALSSALIIHQLKELSPEAAAPMANYAYYAQTFGDLKTAEERECNPEVLIRGKLERGEPLPGIFLACGTEDMLVETNRAFRDFLRENGVSAEYHESAGMHDWKFWNQYLEPAIRWMLGEDA